MSIEAMKQALEALIAVEALIEHQYTGTRDGMTAFQDASDDAHFAIEPLRQAIEQAEKQKPTRSKKMRDAGMTRRPKGWDKDGDESEQPFGWLYSLVVEGQVVNEKFTGVNWDTRYEPFGRHNVDHGGEVIKTPLSLYTSPPPRQPLSDEQISVIVRETSKGPDIRRDGAAFQRVARAIEAAHGIKGEA